MNDKKPRGERGYDAARTSRDADLLGRRALARSVYALATDVPEEWSVRVGVYGAWGSGKTTVLHFIEGQAAADGHAVVWFNPWQYDDQDTLLEGFFRALSTAVAQITGKKPELVDRTKAVARGVTKIIQKVSPVAAEIHVLGKVTQSAVGLLQSAVKLSQDDIAKLASALQDHRLLILIDDVDRAHPSVVPKVFFWIHELFDLAGMSFVLAFDIDRVVPVLQAHHPGFDGRWFLEKIIDFHRWIPACSSAEVLALALDERRRHAPFLSDAIVTELAGVLPSSPRAIRGVFRQLRALTAEVKRHNDTELDLQLLLLVELTRAGWPSFFEDLRSNPEIKKDIIFGAVRRHRLNNKEAEEALIKDRQAIADKLGENERHEVDRLQQILELMRLRLLVWDDAPDLGYHAYLSERPHAVTNGEFQALVESSRGTLSAPRLSEWITKQSKLRDHSRPRVAEELFVASLALWLRSFEATARTISKVDQETAMLGADDAQSVFEALWTLRETSEPSFAPEASFMTDWAASLAKWWHFRDEVYRLRLRAGQRLLIEVLKKDLCPPSSLVNLLHQVRGDRAESASLDESIAGPLEDRLARLTCDAMLAPGGVRRVARESDDWVWSQVVLSSSSPLWRAPLRETILQFLRELDSRRQEDLVFLVRALLEDGRSRDHVLVDDIEIRSAIWLAATRWPLNRRIRGTLDSMRKQFLQRIGPDAEATMTLPAWWDMPLAPSTEEGAVEDADAVD